MVIKRPFWSELIEKLWTQRSIIWLMGVRRVGKTSLCMSLSDVEYFDCESPRTRYLFDDPDSFLLGHKGKRLVLDEIHRLANPSELLKLAADHYPDIKIIATGSSTLGASSKFRDTLTGRKKELWLTPLFLEELAAFGNQNIMHRMLFGGLPSFFVEKQLPVDDFKEWIDSYWAKDIQELFKVEKRYSFQKFVELLLAQSGGQFEVSKFSIPCEVARPTITNYLAILEETLVVHVVRPYSTYKVTEIVASPKVYGFDTGFVCYAKGWSELRKEDTGLLWEHLVLNNIQGHLQDRVVHYWRDKRGHEIDFVLVGRGDAPITVIECKYSIGNDLSKSTLVAIVKNMQIFRQHYPEGKNYVVASDITLPFERTHNGVTVTFIGLEQLIQKLKS